MEILARAVGRRKEAVAQVQLVRGNGQFFINDKPAQVYLQNNSCSLICIKSPLQAALSLSSQNSENLHTNDIQSLLGQGPQTSTIEKIPNSLEQKPEDPITISQPTEQSESLNFTNVADNLGAKKPFFEEQKSINNGEAINESMQLPVNGASSSFDTIYASHDIDVIIKVKGGGLIGQAEAIKLGVARAFCIMENSYGGSILRKILKTKGYLTQDSRVKERRKYGLKKARKASQYHKR